MGKDVAEKFYQVIIVLPPKSGSTEKWGIARNIMDFFLKAAITFHDVIHGFIPKRDMGTAIMEAKLQISLAWRKMEDYYTIFFDMLKAYDTVNCGWTMKILKGYGIGLNMCRFLEKVWSNDMLATHQEKLFGSISILREGYARGMLCCQQYLIYCVTQLFSIWRTG